MSPPVFHSDPISVLSFTASTSLGTEIMSEQTDASQPDERDVYNLKTFFLNLVYISDGKILMFLAGVSPHWYSLNWDADRYINIFPNEFPCRILNLNLLSVELLN